MPQNEDGAVLRRNLHESVLNVATDLGRDHGAFGVGGFGDPIAVERLLPSAPLDEIEALVDCDAIEPTEELVLRVETGELLVGLEESVLSEIRSVVAVADHPEDGVVDWPLISDNQDLESVFVSTQAPSN